MARTYGAIYTSIWRNTDWRTLHFAEQYLYMTLVSQAKLNRAGLLEYSPRRWAEATVGLSPADVEGIVKSLERQRYVVLDESTNELLIRTYVRNDGAWKMPKVMAAVVSAANEIDSPKLRRALLLELDHIPVDELSDVPAANGGTSVRSKIEKCIEQLRSILHDGEPGDSARATFAMPVRHEFGPYIDAPAVPDGKGIDTQRQPSGTGTRVPAPEPAPTPEPAPSPLPPSAGDEPPRPAESVEAADGNPPPVTTQTIIAEYVDRCRKRPPGNVIGHLSGLIKQMLDEGVDPDDVRRGIAAWKAKGQHPSTLPSFVNELMNRDSPMEHPGADVIPIGRQRPGQSDLGSAAHMARFIERQQARKERTG